MEIADTRTDRLLKLALQGLTARQRTIADNVANVDTPDFKASHVGFETALKQAIGHADRPLPMAKVKDAVPGPDGSTADLQPTVTVEADTGRRNDGNNVDVDREMLELTDTNLRFNALIQSMGARLQTLRYVINDGRR